jgi:virulence-associated protein VapD
MAIQISETYVAISSGNTTTKVFNLFYSCVRQSKEIAVEQSIDFSNVAEEL